MPISPDQLCTACTGLGFCLYEKNVAKGDDTVENWFNAKQRGCKPALRDAVLFKPSEPEQPLPQTALLVLQ